MTWRDTYHAHWIETPLQGLGAFLPALVLSSRNVPWSYVELGLAILYLNVRAYALFPKCHVYCGVYIQASANSPSSLFIPNTIICFPRQL